MSNFVRNDLQTRDIDSFNHVDFPCDIDLSNDPALATDEVSGLSDMLSNVTTSLVIGLVDDHRFSRECLSRSFEESARNIRVSAFETIDDVLANPDLALDLILLTIHVGTTSERALLDGLARIGQALPDVPLVVMTDAIDEQQYRLVREVFSSGGQGLISTKSTGINLAIAALRLVKAGGTFAPAHLLIQGEQEQAKPAEMPTVRARFTARQVTVLTHLARGSANKIIAHELQMSESTVKVHVRNIMRRVGATNRTQAVYKAQALGHGGGLQQTD